MFEHDSMRFRPALERDVEAIESLLEQFGLPYDDCEEQIGNLFVVEVLPELVGVGGLELYGEVALLRSIAVQEEYRGQGIGNTIYTKLMAEALSHGVNELYLLTKTAGKYFEARGFSVIDRSQVPEAIQQTKQFSSLCPSSANVMKTAL